MKFWRMAIIAGILLGSGFTQIAEGAVRPYSFYFHPHGGIYDFNEDQAQEDAPYYGLGVGYRFSRTWSSEIDFSFIDSEEKGETIDNYLLRWEFLYHLRPEARLTPFLSVGLGGILSDNPEGTDIDALVGYGLGMEAFLTESIALRLDGRHLFTASNIRFEGKEYQNFSVSAGLVLQVGGEEEKPETIDSDGDGVIDSFDRCPGTRLGVPVDGFGCPADTDQDGIPDYQDKCPDTPSGVPVDRNGCPADAGEATSGLQDKCSAMEPGVQVDRAECPEPVNLDTDADGVLNAQDKCPETRPGIAVDADGCPADTDRDGVPDHLDACPRTPEGTQVDVAGCPPEAAEPSLTLQLEFAPGSSELKPEDLARLQKAVDFLQAQPGQRMLVEGHTDSVGSEEANLRLSRARADNVRRYLIDAAGVAPERIQARGHGETRPVADNSTQEGRWQNRRVVIRVLRD